MGRIDFLCESVLGLDFGRMRRHYASAGGRWLLAAGWRVFSFVAANVRGQDGSESAPLSSNVTSAGAF